MKRHQKYGLVVPFSDSSTASRCLEVILAVHAGERKEAVTTAVYPSEDKFYDNLARRGQHL